MQRDLGLSKTIYPNMAKLVKSGEVEHEIKEHEDQRFCKTVFWISEENKKEFKIDKKIRELSNKQTFNNIIPFQILLNKTKRKYDETIDMFKELKFMHDGIKIAHNSEWSSFPNKFHLEEMFNDLKGNLE